MGERNLTEVFRSHAQAGRLDERRVCGIGAIGEDLLEAAIRAVEVDAGRRAFSKEFCEAKPDRHTWAL